MMFRSLLLLAPVLFWSLFCSPCAMGQLIVTERFSEVWYNSINLTDGNPPSTAFITSTSLTKPFGQSLGAQFNFITVAGARNTGQLLVAQNTTFSASDVFSDVSQSAMTTTDFDHPAIYTRSRFVLDFFVNQETEVTLTGLIEGSSNPADPDFARVELSRDFSPIFSTSFSTFPFFGTLYPGYSYRLGVEAGGYSAFNDSTSSRAVITFSATTVPEPCSMALCSIGVAGLLLLHRSTRRSRIKGTFYC